MTKRIEDTGTQRAAVYIRVSTEEQAQHGLSLQAQQETLLKYAEDNGLKLAGVYADQGITARKKYRNRGEFMRMLDDVEHDRIDIILFIKLDRWFRNVADYYEVQKFLDKHNVRWIATEENYDTTTANGRLHLNIKLSIAQDESDRTSERIKFVFDSKIKRGEFASGNVAMGYKLENKRIVLDPEKAEIVKDIFDRYISVRSINAIRKYAIETYGIVYSLPGWKKLLMNEAYIGKFYGEEGFCDAIVDRHTFSLAQEILAVRAQRNGATPKYTYLFTGLLRCAECGNRLQAHTSLGKYVNYQCTRYSEKKACVHRRLTKEKDVEHYLLLNLESSISEYNALIAKESAPAKVDTAKIKRKMEKLKDLYLNDLIDRSTYERDYTALRDGLNAMPPINREPVDLGAVREVLSMYNELPKEGKKEVWSKLIRKITVTQDGDFFITPVLP